jgi:hypothetical protein
MPNEDNVGAAKVAAKADPPLDQPPEATQERKENLQNDTESRF